MVKYDFQTVSENFPGQEYNAKEAIIRLDLTF